MKYEAEITGLAHIGIPTENLKASREFFQSIGFSLLEDFLQPNGRPVNFMGLGNVVLEIFEVSKDEAAGKPGALDHVALNVKDIEEIFAKMNELGYEALEGKITLLDFGARKVRYFTISGPDGEKIEFSQNVI